MIVTRTPLRVSFFGGGSDIPQFYETNPGLVISTTIDRYIQIAVNRCEPKHVRVVYSELEQADHVDQIKHTRAKAVLKRFNIQTGIEIASFSDITTKGSGLGSSSSYTVGLINAMYNLKVLGYNRRDLAESACDIEIKDLCEPIGKQDQYAAAYGGFNSIRFDGNDVEVTPVPVTHSTLAILNERLMCFSTGMTRQTSSVLDQQVKNLKDNQSTVDSTARLVDMADTALRYLKDIRLDDFGSLLHDGWMEKKKLASGISNPHIDTMYESARRAGALGGKILGAGGGGYMLLYVPSVHARNSVRTALKEYRQFYFKFTDQGSVATQV
jgi:D-glycero-alpha-D-manno-heptose-7-phosphate kinase